MTELVECINSSSLLWISNKLYTCAIYIYIFIYTKTHAHSHACQSECVSVSECVMYIFNEWLQHFWTSAHFCNCCRTKRHTTRHNNNNSRTAATANVSRANVEQTCCIYTLISSCQLWIFVQLFVMHSHSSK